MAEVRRGRGERLTTKGIPGRGRGSRNGQVYATKQSDIVLEDMSDVQRFEMFIVKSIDEVGPNEGGFYLHSMESRISL